MTPEEKAANLEYWSGPVDPLPLGGGKTNTNFTVEDKGERFVVRIGEDIPIHGVMRFNELAAAQAAHAVGISPEVVFHTQGAFVMRFIDGTTFEEEDVRKEENLERILRVIQTCHQEIPQHFQGPALAFSPFHAVRNYVFLAGEANSRMSAELPRFIKINDALEETVGRIRLVFGHNDLLAGNFIDDGRQLWLVDWDYGGYSAALFDLANLCSNNLLSSQQEDWLLENYFQESVTDALRLRLEAMKCASLLRETLWSIVQESHSSLDVDFEKYTRINLERFNTAYQAFR